MVEFIDALFSYAFLSRALAAGLLISLCAALLGVSMVLRRYSMIGDGLSHVGFGAVALAAAMNLAPLTVAIPVVLVAALLLLRFTGSGKLKGDAAIAMISSVALSIGVIIVAKADGVNIDLNSYLFGSILVISESDLWLSVILAAAMLVLFMGLYSRIFTITFDETFARATGVRTGAFNTLIAVLMAVTIVLGMRMMGSLLISAVIIFPTLSAMRLCRSFKGVTIAAALVAVLGFTIGLIISFVWGTPVGASIVVVNFAIFVITAIIGRIYPEKH